MPELGPYGSARGAAGNSRPYRKRRDCWAGHTLRRPASEKRPSTKSRWVGYPAVQQSLWGFVPRPAILVADNLD